MACCVSTSLKQVAESLEQSSFAVYRVSDLQTLIDDASMEILAFFKSDNDRMAYQTIIGGHLHGFNEPSNAKLLFRAFFGTEQHQPWPTDRLKDVSTKLAQELHILLQDCLAALVEKRRNSDEKNNYSITSSPPRKRRDNLSSSSIPDGCPLDYFLYHGNNKDSSTENCTAHVDRGVLICIYLSKVPGLEIYSNGVWVCPEEELNSNDSLVCIMAGQQLNANMQRRNANTTAAASTIIPPCIHRVRNSLSDERLSITYEWRQSES
jgi:hypothetical protein